METSDRTAISRRALAWTTLGLLLFAFAPRAAAEPGECETLCPVEEAVGGIVDQLPLPEVEVPELEVPVVEVPEVEIPIVDEILPEVPEVDPGEVIQGPGTPQVEAPAVQAPAPVKDVTKPQPPTVPEQDVRPVHPVSAADGITKLVPTQVSQDDRNDAAARAERQAAAARVKDTLLRVPGDPTGRDPDLSFMEVREPVVATGPEVTHSARRSVPAQLADFAAAAVKHAAFPLGLALAVIGFLMVQRRLDHKDPKLQMAPVTSEFESFS